MENKKNLFLIPARKGSKQIKNKNIRKLFGKPLISYTLDYVKDIQTSNDISCVSTDDKTVIELANKYSKINIIKRPKNLALDDTPMELVIKHAIDFFKRKKIFFEAIVLLQPTSPIRQIKDFNNLKRTFNKNIDMVVSVRESRENPYHLLYEESQKGFLTKLKEFEFIRRQDLPKVYCLNGSFFMINVKSIINKSINKFSVTSLVNPPQSLCGTA